MDKKTLERLREIGAIVGRNWRTADGRVVQAAARELERLDAERGKDAVAWRILDKSGETLRLSESSADVRFCQAEGFPNVPLFLSPTIPEGMVMVDKKLLSTTIKLTKEASETEFNRQPLSDELYGVSLMLAAAQGERNVNTF